MRRAVQDQVLGNEVMKEFFDDRVKRKGVMGNSFTCLV